MATGHWPLDALTQGLLIELTGAIERLRTHLRPGIEWLDFQKDDLLLCCSDGVWEFLSNVEALNIVSQA